MPKISNPPQTEDPNLNFILLEMIRELNLSEENYLKLLADVKALEITNSSSATSTTNADHILVVDNENANENNLIPFIEDATATGNVGLESDGDFHYNPSTGTVTATTFSGNFSGSITNATTATNADHVSVADNESTDENNLIPFIEDASATGNVGLESDGDFHYNPSTGTITATVFKGNIDAVDGDFDGTLEADAITVNGTDLATVIAGTTVTTATNANHVSVADNESTNEENLIPFIEDASATGNVGLESDGDFAYNPSTGTVSATVFKGNIDAVDGDFDGTLEADAITVNGTALGTVIAGTTVTNATNATNATLATTATNANHVSVADNENTDENNLIPFIEDATATGNVGLESDGDLTYNPSTGRLTATQLAGTLQTASQTNITGVGTLTGLTVDGDATFTGDTYSIVWDKSDSQLEFPNNAKLTFGDASDFEISHDGSNSIIRDNGNHNTWIQTNGHIVLSKVSAAEYYIICYADAQVQLRYNNVAKLETNSAGIRVYGGINSNERTLLATTTLSDSGTCDFSSSYITDAYNTYDVVFVNVHAADDNVALRCRMGTANSATTDYRYSYYGQMRGTRYSDSTELVNYYDNSETYMAVTPNDNDFYIGNHSSENFNGHLRFFNLRETDLAKGFENLSGAYRTSDGYWGNWSFGIGWDSASDSDKKNYLSFFLSSGNFASGTVKLYGLNR